MIRTVIGTLVLVVGLAFAPLASAQHVPPPSEEERIRALIALYDGDFAPWGRYLENMLAHCVGEMRQSKFNPEEMSKHIKRDHDARGITLTPRELDEKVRDLRASVLSAGQGVQNTRRENVRRYYDALAFYYSSLASKAPDDPNMKRAVEYKRRAAMME